MSPSTNQAEVPIPKGAEATSRRLFIEAGLYSPVICGQVRIQQPERLLNTIPGVRAVSVINGWDLNLARPEEDKVFIWQRAMLRNPEILASHRELLRRGYLVIAEWDDDPERFPDHFQHAHITLAGCHAVQTTTEALAKVLRQYNPHVKVFQNQVARLPPPRTYREEGPVTLFYGAINRQPDWKPLMPTLNRLLSQLGERVFVHVVWDFGFFFELKTPHKDFEPLCSADRYLEIMRDSDVALLPLNATRFNMCKSDLKFIECASQGVTVLASPTAYQETIRPEETGLLFETAEQMETQLQRLTADRLLRLRLADSAYQYVAQTRLLEQHYRERFLWYLAMHDRLPELHAELQQRVPALFPLV